MRVLHVVGGSGFGGGAQVILALARRQVLDGHDVSILTTDVRFQQACKVHMIDVVDLGIPAAPPPVSDLVDAIRLRRWLSSEDVDLVHTHTSRAGVVGRWAAHAAHVPVIVHTVHGFAFHDATHPMLKRTAMAIERWAAKRCDIVVPVSRYHEQVLRRYGSVAPSALQPIPNGTSPDRVSSSGCPQEIRSGLGANDATFLVVSHGRVVSGKGLEELIKAGRVLRRSGVPLVLAIVGEGDLRAELERMVVAGGESWIRFTGFTSEIGAHLAAADVVALPSAREGMSISLLEAMSAGKPVVVSTVTSGPEVTGWGEAGRLVPVGDVAAIADALLDLWNSPATRATLGRRARERHEANYTEQRMLDDYSQLYARLEPSSTFGQQTRALTPRDAKACARLHTVAFPRFFLTSLGEAFLERFYGALLTSSTGRGWGVFVNDELVALAAGNLVNKGFYRGLVRSSGLSLAVAAAGPLLRHPSRAFQVIRSVSAEPDAELSRPGPRLLSLCSNPLERGSGFGREALRAFEAEITDELGACSVTLTTDADDNAATIAFYEAAGWTRAEGFTAGDRRMLLMTKPLGDSLGADTITP